MSRRGAQATAMSGEPAVIRQVCLSLRRFKSWRILKLDFADSNAFVGSPSFRVQTLQVTRGPLPGASNEKGRPLRWAYFFVHVRKMSMVQPTAPTMQMSASP